MISFSRSSNASLHSIESLPSHRGSPSMSPKNLHKQMVSIPSRPPTINNNALLINPTKVCVFLFISSFFILYHTIVSIFGSSPSSSRGANFPPIIAWKALVCMCAWAFQRQILFWWTLCSMNQWFRQQEISVKTSCEIKQPSVTDDILYLCNKRRELKKNKYEERAKKYLKANLEVKKDMRRSLETWIENQCEEIEKSLKNNSRSVYQTVKKLTNINRLDQQ